MAGRENMGTIVVQSSDKGESIVTCPGCKVPMKQVEATPRSADQRTEEITYECPKCGTRTQRVIRRAKPR
jgi:uncharacterized C2H2 Zn-finger protein